MSPRPVVGSSIKRSPLFYVGDKYKIMPQMLGLFPKNINAFYEPFLGGGSVFLNVQAKEYLLNDISRHLVGIHRLLLSHAQDRQAFFQKAEKIISAYNLSHSYRQDIVPDALKKEYKKTYYAKFNRQGYDALKARVNKSKAVDYLALYMLLIYGFNRMLRFNHAGAFNLPVGNVDFNKNVAAALNNYFDTVADKKISISSVDFKPFLLKKRYKKDDFVYIDPPYLIAASEYNKLWNENAEQELLHLADTLDGKRVRFALSNVTRYNGRANHILTQWMKKYRVHSIESNYINYHNNRKKEIVEVLVTNY